MIWKRRKTHKPETEGEIPGAESGEPPQLSQAEGVPNDMSSMAIGGTFPRSSSVRSGQPVHFSDPRSLAGLDDAQVMLRVRDGDDADALQALRSPMNLLDEWSAPEPSPFWDVRMQARLREEQQRASAGWLQWFR